MVIDKASQPMKQNKRLTPYINREDFGRVRVRIILPLVLFTVLVRIEQSRNRLEVCSLGYKYWPWRPCKEQLNINQHTFSTISTTWLQVFTFLLRQSFDLACRATLLDIRLVHKLLSLFSNNVGRLNVDGASLLPLSILFTSYRAYQMLDRFIAYRFLSNMTKSSQVAVVGFLACLLFRSPVIDIGY